MVIYHVTKLWVSVVQLGRVSRISRLSRNLNTCTDMLFDPNAF